jgi:hypothetical protein
LELGDLASDGFVPTSIQFMVNEDSGNKVWTSAIALMWNKAKAEYWMVDLYPNYANGYLVGEVK